ncbi:MAG: flavodoxin family protein [Cloacibacillus evryensis]
MLDGGPRKDRNTSAMCASFAKGAAGAGAETETVRLFDYSYTGCRSCFACKVRGGSSFGRCGWRDGISELLEAAANADGVVFASPVYLGTITPQLHAFVERLVFLHSLRQKLQRHCSERFETAVIYTMNVKGDIRDEYIGAENGGPLGFFERYVTRVFTKRTRLCLNTYQFDDYGKYVADGWTSGKRRNGGRESSAGAAKRL